MGHMYRLQGILLLLGRRPPLFYNADNYIQRCRIIESAQNHLLAVLLNLAELQLTRKIWLLCLLYYLTPPLPGSLDIYYLCSKPLCKTDKAVTVSKVNSIPHNMSRKNPKYFHPKLSCHVLVLQYSRPDLMGLGLQIMTLIIRTLEVGFTFFFVTFFKVM